MRTGFLTPRVLVREVGSEAKVAMFTPGWTGSGSLAFASGRRYHLGKKNFWGMEGAFHAEKIPSHGQTDTAAGHQDIVDPGKTGFRYAWCKAA